MIRVKKYCKGSCKGSRSGSCGHIFTMFDQVVPVLEIYVNEVIEHIMNTEIHTLLFKIMEY